MKNSILATLIVAVSISIVIASSVEAKAMELSDSSSDKKMMADKKAMAGRLYLNIRPSDTPRYC